MEARLLVKASTVGYMKKRPKRRMLRMTMIVMTIILTRLMAKSSKVSRAKREAELFQRAVF
jgi:hypothetical protein